MLRISIVTNNGQKQSLVADNPKKKEVKIDIASLLNLIRFTDRDMKH